MIKWFVIPCFVLLIGIMILYWWTGEDVLKISGNVAVLLIPTIAALLATHLKRDDLG